MGNESDTDALLKDLESKAASSKAGSESAGGADEGGEDIEAFLRQLEGDEYVPPPETKTKTKEKDPLDDEFAALEEAPDAPLEKAEKPEKKSWKEKRAEKKKAKAEAKAAAKAEKEAAKAEDGEVQVVERGESDGLKTLGRVLKWMLVLVPTAAAWWMLGAYLSNWVSAGWLVFAVATVVVLGLPLALRLGVKKGKFIWWTAGASTALTVALVAPLTAPASKALTRYGHWPASAIAEVADLDSDSVLVSVNATVAGWLGHLIHPSQDDDFARKLGTEDALDPEDAPSADADADTTDDAKPDDSKPDETKPDEAKPDETKPDEVKPDETTPDEVKPDEAKPDQPETGEGETPTP